MVDLIVYAIPAFVLLLAVELRAARNWHDRLGYVFGGPTWQPGKGRGLAHNEHTS